METKSKNSNQECPGTLQELLEEMKPGGRYSHLRIVLSNNNTRKAELGETFLYVCPDGFTICQLYDLDYHNDKLWLELKDINCEKVSEVSLDINDIHPQIFFIPMADIRKMVYETQYLESLGDELLEFDYE